MLFGTITQVDATKTYGVPERSMRRFLQDVKSALKLPETTTKPDFQEFCRLNHNIVVDVVDSLEKKQTGAASVLDSFETNVLAIQMNKCAKMCKTKVLAYIAIYNKSV